MTKSCKLFASALLLPLTVVVLLAGCEGPQGPQGEMGPQGPEGETGPQGPAGQDANENCVQCHSNSTVILSRQLQYMTSGHYTGDTWERGGSTGPSYYAACARCHINEGFVDYVNGEAAALISNPTPINCRGCHLIHETGTESDFALRTDDAVTLDLTGDTFDMGSGNLCVNCHQSRTSYAIPEVGGADYEISSSRFGPHHGPQGDMLGSTGGYEVSGSLSYPSTSLHAAVTGGPLEDGCSSCHMAEPWTDQAGGHTMNLWIDEDEPLTVTCQDANCHGSEAADWVDFDYDGAQTEIADLLDDLGALLVTANALDLTDPTDPARVEDTFSADVAGAVWNYFFVIEDQSHGVHNPRYARALLTNSIESLTP